jgi:hypothetical protein
MSKEISRERAIELLWEQGVLDWKLTEAQREIKKGILEDSNRTSVVLCSRRLGKTYLVLSMATEICLKKSFAIVKYAFPKQNMAKKMLMPVFRKLFDDCPSYLKPEFMVAEKVWRFPNGSEIQISGTDAGGFDNLRGGDADLCIVDESGFCDDLTYGVRSVLSPSTKITKARTILVSTPSRHEGHEFIQDWVLPYQAENRIKVFTIYDNPNFNAEAIKEAEDEYPLGVLDPMFQREYLCHIIRSTDNSILPSFNNTAESEIVKSDYVRPVYYDPYVSFDIGGVDLTAILFGYYDYENACLVIEDELIADGSTNTEILAAQIKEKERTLWENPLDKSQIDPYMRVIDTNNKILATDLLKLHGLLFTPVKKDKKQAAINALDVAIARRQIVIHPRCTHLLYHMKFAMWNNAQTDFKKLKDSPSGKIRGGHADALAALIYMHRSIIKSKNPFPSGYNVPSGSNYFKSLKTPMSSGGGLGDFMKKVLKKR